MDKPKNVNTEGPYYGNKLLANKDASHWAAYCASERFDFWMVLCTVLVIGCALCFAL